MAPKRIIFAPPKCFLEENGCLKGAFSAAGVAGSFCVTLGHRLALAEAGSATPTCEDVVGVDAADGANVFGVYDGHGGVGCARAMASWLPDAVRDALRPSRILGKSFRKSIVDAFLRVDERWATLQKASTAPDHSGCTGTLLVRRNNTLAIANVGDSAAVLAQKDGTYQVLTEKHCTSIPRECERIRGLGGTIARPVSVDDVPRVNGVVEVTRSFGNIDLKEVIKADPHVLLHEISSDDDFIIVGSDGLWDAVSHMQAVSIVRANLAGSKDLSAAEELARRAYRNLSKDDISVLVLRLTALERRHGRWNLIAVLCTAIVGLLRRVLRMLTWRNAPTATNQ